MKEMKDFSAWLGMEEYVWRNIESNSVYDFCLALQYHFLWNEKISESFVEDGVTLKLVCRSNKVYHYYCCV